MINKVAGTTSALIIILLGILGLGNLATAFDNSVTSYPFWFHMVIGILLLFITWALYRMMGDYERLTNRYLEVLHQMGYSDLDDYFKKQEERRRKRTRKKDNEYDERAVKLINDIIVEARAKETKEFKG